MAKSLLTVVLQANRAMERERKRQERESVREYKAAVREHEKAIKAEERALINQQKADIKELKVLKKEAKIAHIETKKLEVIELNLKLHSTYEEIDGLLDFTLNFDDYIDLESLRRTDENYPFNPEGLSEPEKKPKLKDVPSEPKYVDPPKPKGLFGRKKKLARAIEEAKLAFKKSHQDWVSIVENINNYNNWEKTSYEGKETIRLEKLGLAKKKHDEEVIAQNVKLDKLIAGLGYGTTEAIEEYLSMVVSNSIYPDQFKVSHKFTFDPATAELNMVVTVPPPSKIENVKSYKYVQSKDEITSTLLSMKAQKDRYSAAVHQVAIRTFHEVFEADRRGLIKSISIEVGTKYADPSTGIRGFIPFIAVAAARESFIEYDLSQIILLSTLKHLGAAVSKNPFELVSVESSGIRKS